MLIFVSRTMSTWYTNYHHIYLVVCKQFKHYMRKLYNNPTALKYSFMQITIHVLLSLRLHGKIWSAKKSLKIDIWLNNEHTKMIFGSGNAAWHGDLTVKKKWS